MKYTAIIVENESWYAGFVKELPGVNTQGKTIEELKENLTEAIQLILDSNFKHSIENLNNQNYYEEPIEV